MAIFSRILSGYNYRFADRRVLCQRRLDLPWFDSEAANLYLMIGATEKLEVPVG
jgi:hypothetical protein